MASEDVQTNIRLPAELKDRIVSVADAAGRSLSAEIAQRLDASFQFEDKLRDLERQLANALAIADMHARQLRVAQANMSKADTIRAAARAEADGLASRLAETSAVVEQLQRQAHEDQAEMVRLRTRAELFEDQLDKRDTLIKMISELAASATSLQSEKRFVTAGQKAMLKELAEYFKSFANDRPLGERIEAAIRASAPKPAKSSD